MNTHRGMLGFRDGDRGTHTSRTIMSTELTLLLDQLPGEADKEAYRRAVVDENVLGKRTSATRKLSFQRLSELYGLDFSIPMFRYLRFLWDVDREGRPLTAFLLSYARDPLLRMTNPAISNADTGSIVVKDDIEKAIVEASGERFGAVTLGSLVRNTASSWTQSGHLSGRVRKQRTHPQATAGSAAMALFLGYLEGMRAQRLFDTPWTRLLEVPLQRFQDLTVEAARHGWLDYLRAGNVVEVRFPGRLTPEEEEWTHESAR
jgi:hypothetical protein